MRKVFITLSSIDDVKVFVNESIMGIFSLDLSKPIELDIHSDDDAACDAFLKKIASFVTSE